MGRCILVVGIGASGTSMVAGCLHKMGVVMGHEAHLGLHPAGFSLYEDAEFYGRFHTRLHDDVYLDLIRRHQRPLWGWKNTLTAKAFPWIVDLLARSGNETRVVAVHRELAYSIEGRINGKCPPGKYYTRQEATAWALEAYRVLIAGLQSVDVPKLHLGYQQMRGDPAWHVDWLAQFAYEGLGKLPDLTAAVENVRP
jgi:hypothetical protein